MSRKKGRKKKKAKSKGPPKSSNEADRSKCDECKEVFDTSAVSSCAKCPKQVYTNCRFEECGLCSQGPFCLFCGMTCGPCNLDYCYDCRDVTYCNACEEFYCEHCRQTFYCVACDRGFCTLCRYGSTCSTCHEEFCNECRLFACSACDKEFCNECQALASCSACDKKLCVDCHERFGCEACEEHFCRDCRECFRCNSCNHRFCLHCRYSLDSNDSVICHDCKHGEDISAGGAAALEKTMTDRKRSSIERADAAVRFGFLQQEEGEREDAGHSFREAIRLAKRADPQLDSLRRLAKFAENKVTSLEIPTHTETEFQDLDIARLAVGGGKCDGCGKTLAEHRAETKRKSLFYCSVCTRAYYCGKTCYKRCWKAGHKDACRKPDQIKVGDYMRLRGLVERPELNGEIVQIIDPLPDAPDGRYQAKTNGMMISVRAEKLDHVRPAK